MPSAAFSARPAGLTRDAIVVAALGLIEERGLEDFSTRKLGERLGLKAMSLYHYFPSREALLDAVVDHMVAEVPLPDVSRIAWKRGLLRLAHGYRAMGHRHLPAVALLALRCPTSPTMQRFLGTLEGLLLKAGLKPRSAAQWLLIQRDYVMGSLMTDHAVSLFPLPTPQGRSGSAASRNTSLIVAGDHRARAFDKGFNTLLDAIARECVT